MPDSLRSARRSGPRAGFAILVVVVAVQIGSIWSVAFFPSQDGPSHQALAALDRQFDRPDGAFLHEYFIRNPRRVPNAFVSLLMDDVLRAVPVPLAERLMLTLYVALLPVAMWYALRAINPNAGLLALTITPFTFNIALQTGFFNFCFSLAAFLFAIGYWWPRQDRLRVIQAGVLAALALWVYFCHLISFAMLATTIAVAGIWQTVADVRARPRGASLPRLALRRGVTRLGVPFAALAPAVVLLASFSTEHPPGKVAFVPLLEKVEDFVRLRVLEVMSMDTRPFAVALAVLLVLAIGAHAVRRVRGRAETPGDAWLAVLAVFVAIWLAVPNEFGGGGYYVVRVALFPYLAVILWMGAVGSSQRVQLALASAAAVVALGLQASYWQGWRQLDGYLAEYVSVSDHIEAGRTVLALGYNRMGASLTGSVLDYRSDAFLHASGYIAARRPIVDLNLYEASSTVFSMMYRPEKDPYVLFPDLEAPSPDADLLGYPARSGGRIDYVILWRASPDDPHARAVLDQLDTAYDRTFVSARGLAMLYKRR